MNRIFGSKSPIVVAIVVAIGAVTSGTPTASATVPSTQSVAYLNAQRAANGIPGDLTNNPNLELGCQQHNRYMQANGELAHGESQLSPYYTPEGAGRDQWQYQAEVLHYEGYEGLGENPWEWAPIHLYLMLDPERTSAGYDSAKYTCMRMGGNRESGLEEAPRFFSYPGPGTHGIYPEETAYESPYVPQQIVGIPAGETTGTNIMLFSLGTDGVDAVSYELTGPGGRVPARMVDADTANEVGSGSWFRGGGVLIPDKPLAEDTSYGVKVVWNLTSAEYEPEGAPEQTEFFTQEFTFTTGKKRVEKVPPQTPVRTPTLTLRRMADRGGRVRFRLRADPVLVGHSVRLAVYRHEKGCGKKFSSSAGPCGWRQLGPPKRKGLKLRRTQVISSKAPANRWQRLTVKASTHGFKLGKTRVLPALTRAMVWGDK